MRRAALGAKRTELSYQPALDGLRGVAVVAVLLYHGGVSWAGGGFLGVEAFFVLSGFLITSLLLTEHSRQGSIHLGRFWARRARRLLPALFVVVIVCSIYESAVGPAHVVPDFGADAVSTLAYIANWHQIWTGSGYFSSTALVSPLQHTWSLAIEEQFYLVWPPVIIFLLGLGRRLTAGRPSFRARLAPLLAACVLGALGSAAEMAWLYHGGSGVNRVYYGTDTRAQGLLAGAALAVVLAMSKSAQPATERRPHGRGIAVVGLGGAVLAAFAFVRGAGEPAWLFNGGFLLVDLAVLAVIWAAVSSPVGFSPVRAILSSRPLVGIGTISYGLYLWHFPLFSWLTEASTGLNRAGLLWLRIAVSFAAAIVSFFVIEQPVRKQQVHGLALGVLAPIALSLSIAAALVAWSAGEAVASVPARHLMGGVTGHQRCSVEVNGRGPRQVLHVCPPLQVLIAGDSIGLTIGMQLGFSEQSYGVIEYDKAEVGCGFVDRGENDPAGAGYSPPDPHCRFVFSTWRAQERRLHVQAVIVEMGYWDELNWIQSGHEANLGDPSFDRQVAARMRTFVREMAMPNVPIVFLSVPVVAPAPWPDGSPAPQASPARHRLINSMLAALTAEYPHEVYYFDLSPYITPGGRFRFDLGTGVCRSSDGIHLYTGTYPYIIQTYCGAHLQAVFLPWLRHLVFARRPRR
ncbi:MAG: acyltransferase family protein [Acidimicrobiales bacterium]